MKERFIRRVAPSLLLAIGGGLLLHNIDRGINEPITSGLGNVPTVGNDAVATPPDSNSNIASNPTGGTSNTSSGTSIPSNVPSSNKGGNSGSKSNTKPMDSTTNPTPPTSKVNDGNSTPANSATNNPATVPAPVVDTKRTILGDAQATRYGIVQVQIVVDASSKIVDVKAIKLPQGGSNQRYSNYAAPILRDEALNAQSAQISFASGASYTSQGYIISLQSAIDKI